MDISFILILLSANHAVRNEGNELNPSIHRKFDCSVIPHTASICSLTLSNGSLKGKAQLIIWLTRLQPRGPNICIC